VNQLEQKIAAEAGARGAISFARFMELALYCPVYGYYEKEGDKLGRRGDFYTSVSVGPLFGQLLASQFADWFAAAPTTPDCQLSAVPCHGGGQPAADSCPAPENFILIEAGAHRGDLALDVLHWVREHQPDIFARLQYWLVEPSIRRQRWQREKLAGFEPQARWVAGLEVLASDLERAAASRPLSTILVCNELLDALPVHRLGWDARQQAWFEWGVAAEKDRFVWTRVECERSDLASWIAESCLPVQGLGSVLPDGFVIEVCPAAVAWWQRAATAVRRGRLVAIDYGGTAEELLVPERREGTLRAYHHHQLAPDPLLAPGEQDLTAHVNLTAIEAAGTRAGFRTVEFTTQDRFLTEIAKRAWTREARWGVWTPKQTRQFQTLVHPEHLGRAFRVLVQFR